jgi:hypothetical protein
VLRSLPVSLSVAGGTGGDDIGVCTVEGVGGNTVGDEVVGEGKTGCVGNCVVGEAGKKVPSGATGKYSLMMLLSPCLHQVMEVREDVHNQVVEVFHS